MVLRVTMKHAVPHHDYEIQLWNGDSCDPIASDGLYARIYRAQRVAEMATVTGAIG